MGVAYLRLLWKEQLESKNVRVLYAKVDAVHAV